ncbi:MAG TPA: hypothetical protein P5533_06850 [Candidatus Cloacimonadota bacterium]|nr:hypothetical protein [Candidatus Cloacimonadota bacterium]
MKHLQLIILVLITLCTGLSAVSYQENQRSEYTIFYTAQDSRLDFSAISAQLRVNIDQLQTGLGIYSSEPVEIFVIPDAANYHLLSRGRENIVEFSDAFYSSLEKRIYIRNRGQINEDYGKVLMHEYIHWYLDNIFERSPLWFHEGMATYYAGQMGYDRYLEFIRARFWGKDTDLFRLGYSYPEDQSDWQQYYLSAYFALQLMKDKKAENWQHFWTLTASNWRKGKSTDFIPTFGQAYQTTLWDFANDYSRYSRRLAWQYLIIGINSLLLALLPIILLWGWFKRRRLRAALPDLPIPVDEELPPDPEQPEDI